MKKTAISIIISLQKNFLEISSDLCICHLNGRKISVLDPRIISLILFANAPESLGWYDYFQISFSISLDMRHVVFLPLKKLQKYSLLSLKEIYFIIEFDAFDFRFNPNDEENMKPFYVLKNGLYQYGGERQFLAFSERKQGQINLFAELQLFEFVPNEITSNCHYYFSYTMSSISFRV